MFVVGLTGDVGAGKTTVASMLSQLGAQYISADRIVSELWQDEDILKAAKDRWGTRVFSDGGTPLPERISEIIFEDEGEYKWLCNLLHPRVREQMEAKVLFGSGLIVAEIPLLFENGVPWWVDFTVYVTSPMEERIKRNSERGWDELELTRREKWLMPQEIKLKASDWVIANDRRLDELRVEVKKLMVFLKKISCCIEGFFTCGSFEEAERIAKKLLEKNLVACTNIVDVESRYLWLGNLESETEYLVVFKSIESLFPEIERVVRDEHSYDLPVVTAQRMKKASIDVRKWIMEECGS
ncbi:dephospho-CoA kinase [Thermovirga lienii DSM 17291]|jgi:dephospho-CoA kinase|uniref:Dephospho-CoA kinase n=1 Tax=Thermovirga lienii (strain ATCC BAA-1197 / DSM 17291 / Cas60314) TaxID=580340 RepID=G7V5C1_THELD|nr:dephospho-CoA kinase [Thermovirga lienii]MDN5318076.1 dephospho-CoA kinase [Thermovirga sp.]AER66904.1 dephospho-CoA kinase [Thermovirga lienii DSM 17291]KUK43144.1 MAG: Dephospho-CoA kinase [Thermovirga lienii]MDN5367287.1 dephospho-CoA kinase [Thermovirga sp.]HCD71977.1 dephospho-CoA kinase [Thermovirga lienii]